MLLLDTSDEDAESDGWGLSWNICSLNKILTVDRAVRSAS